MALPDERSDEARVVPERPSSLLVVVADMVDALDGKDLAASSDDQLLARLLLFEWALGELDARKSQLRRALR